MFGKRQIGLILLCPILLLILTISPLWVYATGDRGVVEIKADNTSAKAGSTAEVSVRISGNPGILGATLEVSYASQLRLTGAKVGDAFSPLTMTKPGKFQSPCKFVWDGQDLEPEDVKDGVILVLSFEVSDSAAVGSVLTINLSCAAGDVVDSNLSPVLVQTVGGSITVEANTPTISTISNVTGIMDNASVVLSIQSQSNWDNLYAFLATYSDSGQMLGVERKVTDLTVGNNTITFDKPEIEGTYTAFLLTEESVPCYKSILITEDTAPTITVSSVSAKRGASGVEVQVFIQNNPGILGMTLTLTFDSEALTLKGATNGEAVKDVLTMTKPGKLISPCNFVWDGQEISAEEVKDGVILTLKFDVSSTASGGLHPVSLSYQSGNIVDGEFRSVEVNMVNGDISVA